MVTRSVRTNEQTNVADSLKT